MYYAPDDRQAEDRNPSGLTPRAETRMEAQAIKRRWNTTPENRDKVLTAMVEIMDDRKNSPSHRIGAGRAYMEAEKQNQADSPQQHLHLHAELDEISDAELHRIATDPATGSPGDS